jgi:hypothetical protein
MARTSRSWCRLLILWTLVAPGARLAAQTCQTVEDLLPADKSAIEATARRYFDLFAKGDSEGLRQSAIPSLAADFAGVTAAVKENQATLAGATASLRSLYGLNADGTATFDRAEFLCGVFGAHGQTASSAVFVLMQLPPGHYAVVILEAAASAGRFTVSFVLQQVATEWKLGGFYVKAADSAGHDAAWFAEQARAFKAKGQTHNAWLYFQQARNLASPVPFLSTQLSDQLFDEAQQMQPADFPADKALELTSGARTYRVRSLFALGVAGEIALIVKYDAADISDIKAAYADNQAVARALLTRYSELADGFTAIVTRATDPTGKDYGTLVPVKDINKGAK